MLRADENVDTSTDHAPRPSRSVSGHHRAGLARYFAAGNRISSPRFGAAASIRSTMKKPRQELGRPRRLNGPVT
jgi:hypothetical protein